MKSNLKEKIYKYLHNFRPWQFSLLTACLFIFFIFLVGPLYSLFSKAFVNKAGAFVGWENYIKYFKNPALSVSVGNTFSISLWATLFSVCIGFAYAYALTRTKIRGKEFFKYMAMIPIFIPTIVHALGLVYLFGKQGILTRAGLVSFELYGKIGIIISEVIYCFPQAFLMFLVALQFADGRLYEVADAMGIPAFKKLWYITLPEIKYTLLNACFVCFTLAFTDFGAPKVIGGSYNVLATDVYKQVAGQFNFNMGAVVGTLLLIPAVVSFIFDRLVTNRNAGSLTAKATTLVIKENKMRDAFFFGLCCLVTAFFLALIATLFLGGLVENYPYNLNLTLQNFNFSVSVGGLASYFNSLKMALFTAIFGTIFVFIFA